jgi:spore coat polysaccharide biosynthesis protein SpsF (cytidylyltransferase family)
MRKESVKRAFVVQARMGSSRLPNKILLPFFEGKSILQLLIEKLSEFENMPIIVATSQSQENDQLVSFLEKFPVMVYRGEENDVLGRFIHAAEHFGVDQMIRICSDNPFLEKRAIEQLLTFSLDSEADYISFKVNDTPSIKTHFGFWTEYVTLNALKRVAQQTHDAFFHEHVTNYIYTYGDLFKIDWLPTPDVLQGRYDIRLTIDTVDDFTNVQKIYADLAHLSEIRIEDLVAYLEQHPDRIDAMRREIQKNVK